MLKNWKCIAVLSLLITALAAGQAFAKPLTINLGYASSKGSTYAILAEKFAELAEKYSNNEIKMKVRCCTQLATEDEAFKSMQLGTIDMFIITSNNISPHFPLMDAFVLPYIFQSKKHTYDVLNGDVGRAFAAKLNQDTGVHLLTYGYVGHRDFYNSKRPVKKMADMDGLKIRVPKNQVMIGTFKAFGAAPIPLAWAETPTALQTKTVDGGDNGTSFIKTQKFYEIAKYMTVLEHFNFFSPLFASDRVMKKMSPAQKEAVLKAAADAGKHHVEVMEKRVKEIRTWLGKEGGMEIIYPEKSEFIQAAIKYQDEWLSDKPDTMKQLVNDIRAAAK